MVVEEQAAKAGAAVTVGAGATGFVVEALPYLQFAAFTVSILVGVLTFAWHGVKFYDRWKSGRS